MADVVHKLTAEGAGGEKAEFLNDIVKQLWPNINVAVGKMVKDIVDPMFKQMLPGPLSSLHFTKIDLGTVPLVISNVKTSKTEHEGIKLDMNIEWDGKADIELDGDMIPAVGVERVQLFGRLSILLAPITNVIPLIGALQVSFVNPPTLKLDFTGAANVADFSAIDDSVRGVILGIINSMFTLPNRFLVKLDASNDYFKTYLYPLGVLRVTVEKAWGFSEESKGGAKKLFAKLTRAAPDCYAKTQVGAETEFRTKTINNKHSPSWNETHDFVVSDMDQCVKIEIYDHDVNGDDEIGMAVTTVRESLAKGGKLELPLVTKEHEETSGKVSLSVEYFDYQADGSSFNASSHKGEGKYSGLATVLVAGATGIKGQRETLKPSVKVTWGSKNTFQTAQKADAPGTDINNPAFDQNFRMQIDQIGGWVSSSADPFKIALLDGETEVGSASVPFADVQNAPNMTLENNFDIGNGTKIRASIQLRGLGSGGTQLPDRSR